MKKRWILQEPVSHQLQEHFPELEPLVLQLLANRGITSQKEVEQFLHPDYEADTHDPFLFQDMEKSVKRIYEAIENNEKITIHGDYDADGVCSSAILVTILRDLGADVDVYIPHREKEGYGVNINTVKYLIEENKTNLIITVDCGTANVEPIEYAESQGVNVIITDHHHAPETLPKSFALINPQNTQDTYPFGYLCGAGVAFKVSQALYFTDKKEKQPKLADGYDKWLLDLVAIATVADMMPLQDENRVLVHYGLIVLKKTRRIGLQKLMENAGIWQYGERELTPFDIGFVVGPRLNAAGRMDHANAAYHLLIEDSEDKAIELVKSIEQSNTDRRAITDKVVEEVLEQVGDDDKFIAFAYGYGWQIGLAGLVAGKVLQEIGKPVIVATKLEDRIAGSGRSIEGFNMAEVLDELRDEFTTAGGHAMACGFSLEPDEEKLFKIKKEFEKRAKEALEGKDLRPALIVDAVIRGKDITWKMYDAVQKLKPFGKDNSEPIFILKDVILEDVRAVGKENRHLKLRLQDPTTLKAISAIAFSFGDVVDKLQIGSKVDIACTIDANEWNGNRELQLKVEDIEVLGK